MKSRIKQKGQLRVLHFDRHDRLKSDEVVPNEAKDEGLNFLLDVVFGTQSVFTWFMGIIDNAGFVSVATDDTYLQLQADALNWDELDPDNYNFVGNTNRQAISFDAAVAGRIANDLSPLTFVMTVSAAGKEAKGIFITDTQGVADNSGFLWATALFGVAKQLEDGDRLVLTYETTQARV